jgi:DamX protein
MVQSDLINSDWKQADTGKANVNALQSLLSPARKQKLELLASLIKTQQQSLIICGPEGIGKTTILKRLAKSNNTKQLWNYVECDSSLTVSILLTHLSSVLSLNKERTSKKNKSKVAQKLAGQLSKIAKNGHTVVLVLDDAGHLQAGVITKLFAFARQCEGLQLILAITPNDLFLKRTTDYVIDDCYVVDIPPLTEQESESFTLNFLQENKQRFDFDTLPENFTTEIYRKSQGIPGAVLQGVSKMSPQSLSLSGENKFSNLILLGSLGLIGLFIWGGLSFLGGLGNHSTNTNYVDLNNAPPPLVGIDPVSRQTLEKDVAMVDEKPQKTPVSNESFRITADSSMISVVPTTEDILNSTLADDAASLTANAGVTEVASKTENNALAGLKAPNLQQDKPTDETDQGKKIPSNKQQTPALVFEETLNNDPNKSNKTEEILRSAQTVFPGVHGPNWVLKQDKNSYTLQLMASSEKETLLRYIEQSSKLHAETAYYLMKLKGEDWFGLIYGVYPTVAAAKKAMRQLPQSIGKPYMLRINEVQGRIQDYQ